MHARILSLIHFSTRAASPRGRQENARLVTKVVRGLPSERSPGAPSD